MPARHMQPLRIVIQLIYLGFMLWLGYRFYQFVDFFRSGGGSAFVARPDAIEGFLPISGLLGAASWFKGGGFNGIHPAAVVLFLTIIIVSIILRRSFCSWICPVATVSEYAWKIGYKIFKRNIHPPKWLDVVLRSVKYLLLSFFLYSIAVSMSPEAMNAFIASDYHKMADVRMLDFFLHISPFALCVLLFLLVISFVFKNPFCRYLCPYGALLGLVAIPSPLKVTRNTESCVSCGICSQVCPSHIDVMRKKSVMSPECIGCWRCVSHCRFNQALTIRAFGRFEVPGLLFALLLVVMFWGGSAIGKISGHWHTELSLQEYAHLLGK